MRKVSIALVLCAGCVLGQTTATADKKMVIRMRDPAEFGPVGITTMLAAPMGTVTGAPYSAQVVTQRTQVLADGNRIEQSSTGSVARDGQGRVRRDEALPSLEADNGESAHIVMIDDPVAQVHWTLDAQTRTAMKIPFLPGKGGAPGLGAGMPPPLSNTRTFFYTSGTGPMVNRQTIIKAGVAGGDPNVAKADLGTQMIEGVSAQGTRITRTIPARQVGNEQPITITTETWYSPELKVLVMSKSSDPRMGDTVYKLTDIQRAEPAASLFQPPDEYAVKDGLQDHLFVRETKKP